MSAPVNNQFWKNRTVHGRDKLFSSPEVLWQEAVKYFDFCDENPLVSRDYKGKDADSVDMYHMRAYTWSGLELFLDISSLREYKTNPAYEDFSQVITRIEKIMTTQKFEGAAAGLLNPNIIARDLGLVDQKDLTTKGDKLPEAPKATEMTVTIVYPNEVD